MDLLRPGSVRASSTCSSTEGWALVSPMERDPYTHGTSQQELTGSEEVTNSQSHKKISKLQSSFQRNILYIGPLEPRTPGRGRPWLSQTATKASS